ncbi:MAG: SIS domain-containing protein [Desulfomonilaceae bacterium]
MGILKELIENIFEESINVKKRFLNDQTQILEASVKALAACLRSGGKLMIFGNGGSAADAQHLAAEFVNRYLLERPPLAAMALTTDSSILTAVGNDYDFSEIFEKQLRALGKRGDVALGISTSGSSVNVIKGLKMAKSMGLVTIGLGGAENSAMKEYCDFYLAIYGSITPRIQETQILVEHILVELVDQELFGVQNTTP